MAKFDATDDGRKFIHATAGSWRNAHLASGSDSVEVRA